MRPHAQPLLQMNDNPTLSYADAGVDIDAGNELVELIKPEIKRTQRPEVLGGLGGFGGMFELPVDRYKQPILVSGTDGVGTKLMLATQLDKHNTIGIDLVAMCVNDILVCGAEPLYFLDYYACGKIKLEKSRQIIAGIAEGCVQAGAALIGGESAEMPGMYDKDDYDLAGFAVGVVEKNSILDKNNVTPGDAIIGVASSGFHSNGYSLVRKVIEDKKVDINATLAGDTIGDLLIKPTRIYVKPILNLLQQVDVHALAHITGGGITENIPRSLPPHTTAMIDRASWQQPAIFNWLQEHGNIEADEMLRTFNCGIGMAVIVAADQRDHTLQALHDNGEQAMTIGEVTKSADVQPSVQWR